MDDELIPIYQMPEKYGIGRTAFYDRLNDLNIEPIRRGKRSFITKLEKDLFERYHHHLTEEGGTRKSFEQPIAIRSSVIEPVGHFESNGDILALIEAISKHFAFSQSVDPIASQKALIFCCENTIILGTGKVRELIGSKPKGESYQWGSFVFDRAGKIGRESGWKVRKTS